jgi:hypothetical protein
LTTAQLSGQTPSFTSFVGERVAMRVRVLSLGVASRRCNSGSCLTYRARPTQLSRLLRSCTIARTARSPGMPATQSHTESAAVESGESVVVERVRPATAARFWRIDNHGHRFARDTHELVSQSAPWNAIRLTCPTEVSDRGFGLLEGRSVSATTTRIAFRTRTCGSSPARPLRTPWRRRREKWYAIPDSMLPFSTSRDGRNDYESRSRSCLG